MTKRLIVGIVAVAFLVVCLPGCGADAPTPKVSGNPASQNAPVGKGNSGGGQKSVPLD